ncbi:1,4-dihydroxy-2-naphthoate polyprenyltransferase [Marivirga sp. S37H4]|uniref:1,4-dihydroxy-2-naphthoate octaprenyltransferase n=1 Tax=Marivirga aurantiaca TaxID=2802615 RepID=A0A935CBH4_9BACT|nr:1,4-dihydroxy-2-naphthoate polyprenyltransferase [Marivirga aurantiaca]MBK6266787.1 1,4-dihydroxy-2-naphthoate polyprenyltransferase [Marivirga aurantiaca]
MLKHWIEAFRLRTLPLALACIGMGSFLAAFFTTFNWIVCVLSLITTLFLQILSNLANDYGDTIHGADSTEREGPSRAVQKGAISPKSMMRAIIICSILSFISGLLLLHFAVGIGSVTFYVFLGIGLLAIFAAIAYTNGKRPYGYMGLGDIFVFLFFGLVGVVGTYYLHAESVEPTIFLPAMACGFLAAGVLNVNNIRDIKSDELAGKRSIPVRIGQKNAKIYHYLLIGFAWISVISFIVIHYQSQWNLLVFLSFPLFIYHAILLWKSNRGKEIDPLLKQLALSTLFFVLTFGFGIVLF